MTGKELAKLIRSAVRAEILKVVKEQVKPIVRQTIKEEFRLILEDAAKVQKPKKRTVKSDTDNLSIATLMNEVDETVEKEQITEQETPKLFKKSQFADVLNQTAREYAGTSVPQDSGMGINEQKEFVLNTNNVPSPAPSPVAAAANSVPMDVRQKMVQAMGYGTMENVGENIKVPGTEVAPSQPEQKVQLPTTTPDNRPIDYSKVPAEIVSNMMEEKLHVPPIEFRVCGNEFLGSIIT